MRKRVNYHGGGLYQVGSDYVQVDYDYPAAAQTAGWNLARVQMRRIGGEAHSLAMARRPRGVHCAHRSTDGTVGCPDCGIEASAFIGAARCYLDRRAAGR
jgi:hypothetical protein